MVKYDLIFKVMKIVLQKWLCVMLLVASMSACALQQRKPIMKERPGVVRQMVENRDFKVDFSATPGGGGWSFSLVRKSHFICRYLVIYFILS